MKMLELKEKAKKLGVKPGKLSKVELIRQTQQAEGFNACFGTANGSCPHTTCCFYDDCLKTTN
jgi:predicted metal-binding transcription factor (methanogenesis marker protein 9)